MSPNATPDASLTDVLNGLDDPSIKADEGCFLNRGDDVLDVALGLDNIVSNIWLFDCQQLPVGVYAGDAICVGSGPSLDRYMGDIKRNAKWCLIVAAHSAVPKLLANGIVPDVICPKERDPDIGLIPKNLPPNVVYAGLPVVPAAPDLCARAWLVGTNDHMMDWLGYGRKHIGTPPTSGTLAASVAATLVTGAVHLVGHDLVYGHYVGYTGIEESPVGTIMCGDGIARQSTYIYRQALHALNDIAQRSVLIQVGKANGAISGPYAFQADTLTPQASICPKPEPLTIRGASNAKKQIRRIPGILRRALARVDKATTAADLSAQALGGPDHLFIGSLCQSVYLSTSILRRTIPLDNDACVGVLREAIGHALASLRPVAEKWRHACRG